MSAPDAQYCRLLEPEGDATLTEIVGGHLNGDPVTRQYANTVFPHLAGGVRQNFVIIIKLYAEHGIRQQFSHRTIEFHEIFFSHELLSVLRGLLTWFELVCALSANNTKLLSGWS
jgi:hypothetical protein